MVRYNNSQDLQKNRLKYITSLNLAEMIYQELHCYKTDYGTEVYDMKKLDDGISFTNLN
jgi:hypothetical protein